MNSPRPLLRINMPAMNIDARMSKNDEIPGLTKAIAKLRGSNTIPAKI